MGARIFLRRAGEGDAGLLYMWRNDALTRKNSFNTEPIPYAEHLAWLKGALSDDSQKFYILHHGEEPVGQVRVTLSEGVGTITYSIAPERRGQGYGKIILSLVENECAGMSPPILLRGCVKPGNVASQLVFEALGYEREEPPGGGYIVYSKRELHARSAADAPKSTGGGHSS